MWKFHDGAKPHTEGREVNYGKIGLMTVAVSQGLSGMPLVLKRRTHPPLEQYSQLLEPGQPSAQLSKLILLSACKKTMHTVSQLYRTVYIPWLVISYNTLRGKHWLNSDPPNHRGWVSHFTSRANAFLLVRSARSFLSPIFIFFLMPSRMENWN